MGVLLLAGMPTLFCDVSDAWRLPSKWRRIGVSASGMLVGFLIAALAAIVWSRTEPGVVHAIALSLLVVCSVGTLAINANPLLRYDGYYILSDWLEVPNLAERARGLIDSAWRRHGCWANRRRSNPGSRRRSTAPVWIYAIGSKIYMGPRPQRPLHPDAPRGTTPSTAKRRLRPRGRRLGRDVDGPGARGADGVWRPIPRCVRDSAGGGLPPAALLLAGATTAIYFMPMEHRVTAPLVVCPATPHPLFAVAAGELRFHVAAPEGSEVAAGAVVVRLSNPELELALAEAQGDRPRTAIETSSIANAAGDQSRRRARRLPTAQSDSSTLSRNLPEHQTLVDSLTFRRCAPSRGHRAPPRQVEEPWPRPRAPAVAWLAARRREPRRLGSKRARLFASSRPEQAPSPGPASSKPTLPPSPRGNPSVCLSTNNRSRRISGRVTQVARRRLNHDKSESGDAPASPCSATIAITSSRSPSMTPAPAAIAGVPRHSKDHHHRAQQHRLPRTRLRPPSPPASAVASSSHSWPRIGGQK